MRVIAFYLPQFHRIPENDSWWGEGFTEWVNVKKACPLYEGHYQPRIPQDNQYYNLLDSAPKYRQVQQAKENGVYGFCFYHYWFSGHMLLEKPVEQFLSDPGLDIHFCLSWANESWTNAWVSKSNKVLIEQTYGGREEWKQHFEYLLPFFKDTRYIRNNNKPLFVIYRADLLEPRNEMLDYWQELAKENGLEGIDFAYQTMHFEYMPGRDDSRFSYNIEYQPSYAFYDMRPKFISTLRATISWAISKYLHLSLYGKGIKSDGPVKYDYDTVWKNILNRKPDSEKSIPGAFVDWDNTPRRGRNGSVVVGATPYKFGRYIRQQIRRAREVYHKDMLFLFAWNEWAEGGYLEPDEKYYDAYLKEIRKALDEMGEDPSWKSN